MSGEFYACVSFDHISNIERAKDGLMSSRFDMEPFPLHTSTEILLSLATPLCCIKIKDALVIQTLHKKL